MANQEICLTPLKQIPHPKGQIFHALKASEESFLQFGEAYFSFVHQNEIKGWKKHTEMRLNLIVPRGKVQFVCLDERDGEQKFTSYELGEENYHRLTVPPGIWMAFRGLDENNMVLNVASIEHDPKEAINKELEDIPYEW